MAAVAGCPQEIWDIFTVMSFFLHPTRFNQLPHLHKFGPITVTPAPDALLLFYFSFCWFLLAFPVLFCGWRSYRARRPSHIKWSAQLASRAPVPFGKSNNFPERRVFRRQSSANIGAYCAMVASCADELTEPENVKVEDAVAALLSRRLLLLLLPPPPTFFCERKKPHFNKYLPKNVYSHFWIIHTCRSTQLIIMFKGTHEWFHCGNVLLSRFKLYARGLHLIRLFISQSSFGSNEIFLEKLNQLRHASLTHCITSVY